MKLTKVLLAVFMAITILILSAVSAFAGTIGDSVLGVTETEGSESSLLGDVNGDYEITILDATLIQMWVAELRELSNAALSRADANLDGAAAIDDTTHIQRYLADFSGRFYLDMELSEAIEAKANDIAEDERLKALEEEQNRLDAEAKQAEEERLKKQNILDRIANFTRAKGVDISEFNGDVDMNKLKAAGYTFVIIRMGFGGNYTNQDDTYFEKNVKKAEEAGMDWGAYLYSYALNTSQAKSEVNHTLRLLKGKKPTMPIAFDMEYDSYKERYLSNDAILHDICVTYLSGIKSAGYYPILYTGYSYLNGVLNKPDIVNTYDIWYAQWSTVMQYDSKKVGIWQYGGETNFIESPYISGLSGMFDKDYSYRNYPLIIPAYGYNNHTAIIEGKYTYTASAYDDNEVEDVRLPDEYNNIMGDSFR